ncbi:MAG: LPXTG cell wall anchor domain-containing protein [Bifidobacteriaceae bacterium]|nr:LPXTG cell wall anchor domain-containing protein [Bifidobacteriaceae bacterium]
MSASRTHAGWVWRGIVALACCAVVALLVWPVAVAVASPDDDAVGLIVEIAPLGPTAPAVGGPSTSGGADSPGPSSAGPSGHGSATGPSDGTGGTGGIGGTGGTGGTGGDLPRTGADVALWWLAAAALIAVGSGIAAARRRGQTASCG